MRIKHFADGQLASSCALVPLRQRPGTANSVLFLMLADETGNENVMVWPSLVEQQLREVIGANFLGVYGQWQQCAGPGKAGRAFVRAQSCVL